MPGVSGTLLSELLEGGKAPAGRDLRDFLLPLLDALDNLHAGGVAHLQIRPDQIFVTPNGRPVLTGLGAAAAAEPAAARSDAYAAPEQVGPRGDAGPAADVYSLAATLYHCVSGAAPPPAIERLAAVKADLPDPLRPAVSTLPVVEYGGLGEAIDQGLALDPAERPMDAAQWRKAFKSLDWRLMIAGREASEMPREGREWLPLTLLAVFLVAMAAIAVFLFSDREFQLPEVPEGLTGQSRPEDAGPAGYSITPEEQRRWEAALDADTVLAYRRFMEDFSESVYLRQAQLQLDILDERLWAELSAEDTREAYEDYLEEFADGLHQAEALQRIEAIDAAAARAERERIERERQDNAAWDAARQERTIESMGQYIGAWPGGMHIEEAERTRRMLVDRANDDTAFETAQKLNSRDAFQSYLDAFPEGAHVTAALQMVDHLTLRPGKVFRDCPECPAMMVIPAGTFLQGSPNSAENAPGLEKPQRTISIAEPFAAGTHEVTMAQWDACVEAGGCSQRPADNGWGRERNPVMLVSWNDVQEYVGWLSEHTGQSYRLPSESEWEYFARAGEAGEWLASVPDRVCEFANIAGSETGLRWQHGNCTDGRNLGTTPVGSFRANAFGLFDVIGNVAEWTLDCLNLSYLDAPVDGSAWTRGICSSHMTRGGSWVTGTRDIRLPARFNLKNADRNDFTGFRVVRTIEE